jgi:hypothetical protein
MDSSLPMLEPIVIKPISSPPFECSGVGLTYKGQCRETIDNLNAWLFPKRKSTTATPLKRSKDWWLAQLQLYGCKIKSASTIATLSDSLKTALSNGLQGPPEHLVQLELELNRRFLLENAKARDKQYLRLDDNAKAEFDSHRFLREKFGETGKEEVLVLQIQQRQRVHEAAEELGLHTISADAPGDAGARWIVVGKNRAAVWDRKNEIEKKRKLWEDEETKAKRKKTEAMRKECEAGGKGKFVDVEGEWSIDCSKMDKEYRKADRRMSIFFHRPLPEEEEEEEAEEDCSDYSSGCHSDDQSNQKKKQNPSSVTTTSRLLCANFRMGILKGILRSTTEPPLSSSKFPAEDVEFSWRGRETGEGEIQLDYEGNVNTGVLTFLSKTQLRGVLRSSFDDFPFSGNKIGKVPLNKDYCWSKYSESAHERERVERWR